jgi:hypothetical protein
VYINLQYYIVTRDCVPNDLLRKWRPSASGNRSTALDKGSDSDIEYGSSEGDYAEISSPLAGPVPLPSTQPALTVRHHRDRSEDKEPEVISISGKNQFVSQNHCLTFSIR